MTASFDRGQLTDALKAEVRTLVDDLRTRADEVPEIAERLTGEWQRAVDAERTAFDLETWREGELAQVAVSWVLGCVFVRFCEDNGLIADPLLSGQGDRRRWANDAKVEFFRRHTDAGERAWLLHVFETASGFHGLSEVFGSHNPLWRFGPSDDACRDLLGFWQASEAESGDLNWSFTDSEWDTRFLGDLYQDLSEHAKKQFALLQTPDFVEEFILDRTLEPALAEFGLRGHDGAGFRLIDPACGSGHFLLGAFARLAQRCLDDAPADGARAAAARALTMVYGVDLNPFAVSIARFRLLVAALRFAGVKTLAEAPNFAIQVATGDSLLWGSSEGRLEGVFESAEAQGSLTRHLYATEDGDLLRRYLGQDYHAVVANPPYITPKDPAANAAYRDRYEACHRQYSLAVPFMERLFGLARRGAEGRPAGFVGQITANSFMKREFGKKLIEEFLASSVDLTHVIDTSGAYIPGHGTPTVILIGRNRLPVGDEIRAVLGIRGEPSTPDEPAKGLVWSSIVELWDRPGAENDFVSSVDFDRSGLAGHPWSLQGGAAAPLKELVEGGLPRLADRSKLIGYTGQTNVDEVMLAPQSSLRRRAVEGVVSRPLAIGELLRDWCFTEGEHVVFPYDSGALLDIDEYPGLLRWVWPARTVMGERRTFAKTSYFEEGRPWWEWHQVALDRLKTPLSIGFAFVATHNHFVLDRGGKVFKQSALVIKLEAGAGEDEHLQLLGLLNSAVACFWMKQVFQGKPSNGIDRGLESEAWTIRSEFDGTKLKQFPLADGSTLAWVARLDELAQELGRWLPSSLAESQVPSGELWAESQRRVAEIRAEMVWLQEELDWRCAHLYGITETDLSLPPEQVFALAKGQRAFEIALARRVAAGETESEWFRRHQSTPVTELPAHWPEHYRQRVDQRLQLIAQDRFANLLERPEYKRRWNWDRWDDLAATALRTWLAAGLEDPRYWPAPEPRSVAQLADVASADADFIQVAELYRGTSDVDYVDLITELMKADDVPYLAAWRYKDSGLRKRASWEKTWDLQRRQDAGKDVGKIPVPPKYGSGDFRSTAIWKARGKLDVPKERFISYPGLERSTDATPIYGWAGWDHLDQAKAVTALYTHRLQQEGWTATQLIPVLAGLAELIPWLQQWHNELDPSIGQGLGDYFDDYLQAEVRRHGLTTADLRAWRPPTTTRRRRTTNRQPAS